MAFEPGNQLHVLARKSKRISEALERACLQEDGARIRQGVEKLLDAFSAGEPWAIQQVWDRYEGKPAQAVTVSGDEDRPLVSMIKMVVVSANSNQINTLEHDEGEKEKLALTNELSYPPLPLPPKVNFTDGGGV